MDPNPQPTPTPAAAVRSDPVVEFIRTDRQTAGYVLLGLALACLIATTWLAWRSTKLPAGAAEPDKKAEKAQDPFNPEPEAPKAEVANPAARDYTLGWLACLAAFLALAGQGAWLLAAPPVPSESEQRTEARKVVLRVGAVVGVILILAGVVFFYRWSEGLSAWLDKGETKEAKWVVVPLLMVIAGAGLIFLAIQPARAEERNNARLRRLVYGSNLALTALLLFVALVVANVAFAVRVPNRLDTTSTGFYTLSEPTRQFLAQLDQPVTAYGILPDTGDRVVDDIRRLLQMCQDAGGGRFRVRFLSPTLNQTDLTQLRARYTQLELNDVGVLLTVGEDEKRYVFLPRSEFIEQANPMARQQSEPAFVGESRLMRELMFLAEAKQRPVVYFTQSNGELSVGGGPTEEPAGPERSASQLKAFLEKNYLDIRPLRFDPTTPKVPDDADVVVVAGPRSTLLPGSVEAVRKYMAEPRREGKKGKLVVLSGNPLPQEGKSVPTGLEPVLRDFNINLGNQYLIGLDSTGPKLREIPAVFLESAVRAKNSIAMTLRRFPVVFTMPREVSAVQQGKPDYRATPLLVTATDYVWPETELPIDRNFSEYLNEVLQNPGRKGLTRGKTVGVVSAESGGAARVAVYGSHDIASDDWARQVRGTSPVEFDLIGVTIDWLRDRPPVPTGVTSKTYSVYTFPPKVDHARLEYLPLGLALLTVVGLGAGVWVIRRK